jgi:Zn-dependent M28 family amino/carboxypeptidase
MNVLAVSYTGDPDNTIVVGSHLDSVLAGPGINDNGSGSSVNLELALQLGGLLENGKLNLTNRVRFAWWAAEEFGLLGSTYYVQNLINTSSPELHEIALNLNFDMLGSPNFYRGIYNGSAHDVGSGQIQSLFEAYFESVNLTMALKPFNERSDYAPFTGKFLTNI